MSLEHDPPPWRIEVYPDWGYPDPVWYRSVGVSLDRLPIRPGLRRDLRAWARRWEDHAETWTDAERDQWNQQGASLTTRLRSQLGPDYQVKYG